ncbi:hypothetical protein ABTM07_20045, partial [Acinetobacter baumannii]
PNDRHTIRQTIPSQPREGWDHREAVLYETSPNEKLTLQALALRKGDRWTVAIIDGSDATVEKRGGAIGLVAQSLRPAGYAKESFAGKP